MTYFKNKPELQSLINELVRVYWNSHKRLFSVQVQVDKGKWRVAGHTANVQLLNATFTVNRVGHRRMMREGVKNVHAFVRGTLIGVEAVLIPDAVMDKEGVLDKLVEVTYVRTDGAFQFVRGMTRWGIEESPQVWLTNKPLIKAIAPSIAYFEVRVHGVCVYRTQWYDKVVAYIRGLDTPATVVEVWVNGAERTII